MSSKSRNYLSEILLSLIVIIFVGWLLALIQLIKDCRARRARRLERRRQQYDRVCCMHIPATIYKRPDPFIYSQRFLTKQGLAVTWDNPDIQLFESGAPVSSSALKVDAEYEVRATYYNGSNEAVIVDMPVHFSFLTFGIGTTSTPIGSTQIDIGVKGSSENPSIATMKWRTPTLAGHYCLQVQADWGDCVYADPDRRFGQENTNVGVFASPAVFEIPVRNDKDFPIRVLMRADTYGLLARISCDDVINGRLIPRRSDKPIAKDELCRLLQEQHKADKFPIPPDWTVDIQPDQFGLSPNQHQIVTITVTRPAGFTGIKAFNVNAYRVDGNQEALIGGVTLYTQA